MSGCHSQNISTVLHMLETNASAGLTDDEAARRLARYGPNELIERGGKSPWFILWEQFASVMVVMLIIAAVVSASLGDYKDTAAILAIVLLNAVLGFRQEYKAEKAMAALKKLGAPNVRVRRSARVLEISAGELTPGDIVLLEAGNLGFFEEVVSQIEQDQDFGTHEIAAALAFLAQQAEEAGNFSGLDPDLPVVPGNYHQKSFLRLKRLT